jgi:hypothetical protein
VLNVIGDHATWHLPADPLLATDVESNGMARELGWIV